VQQSGLTDPFRNLPWAFYIYRLLIRQT
jgi:hypothetical protein